MKTVSFASQNSLKTAWKGLRDPFLLDQKPIIHLYAIGLLIASLLLTGYRIYFSNQTIQLPLVDLLNDPGLFRNDPFASTLPSYSSLLWRMVAWCAQIFPLEPLILALFLCERFLVIYASGYLASTFAPGSRLAIVGTMALFSLAPDAILGGGTLVESYFEQTGFSIPFFLFAIAAFYRFNFLGAAIWLAIVFNLNSMYGVYAATYLLAALICDHAYWKAWRQWLIAVPVLLVLAAPGILMTLSAYEQNAVDNELWLMANEVRFPHHLYPLSWSPIVFLEFGLLAIVLFTLLCRSRIALSRLFRLNLAWTITSLLWLVYAFVAAYIARSPSMLVMHPARATDLWYCLAATTCIATCAFHLEQKRSRINLFAAVLALGTLVYLLTSGFNTRLVAAVFLITLAATLWQPTWKLVFQKGNSNWLSFLLVLGVLTLGTKAWHDRFEVEKNVQSSLFIRPIKDIETIAHWAHQNTSKNAVFLVNPSYADWSQFRALAKRPIYGSWRDGSAILWDRPFVKPWLDRLGALGFDIHQVAQEQKKFTKEVVFRERLKKDIEQIYDNLRDEKVKQIRTKFPIDYWVVAIDHPSAFPVVFQTQNYKVLVLK